MSDWVLGFILGIIVGLVVGFIAGVSEQRARFKQGAIERGYGLYCPTNGDWAWKGECE